MPEPGVCAPDPPAVALVTCGTELGREPDDRQRLIPALAARGLRGVPVVWNDPAVDWAAFRLAVIRSTWDYHLRRDAFLAWIRRAAARTALWNPPAVLAWNTHKFYLRELAAKGLPVLPTVWLDAGTPARLGAILAEQGWTRAVIKPAVGASAYGALRVDPATLAAGQAHLDAWLPTHDMLVQPYLPTVETTGEHSLMFVDGVFTHAVRRTPALSAEGAAAPPWSRVTAPDDEVALAARILAAAPAPALYARVDLLRDAAGALHLMELELTEPFLFLEEAPDAVTRLAAAIAARAGAAEG